MNRCVSKYWKYGSWLGILLFNLVLVSQVVQRSIQISQNREHCAVLTSEIQQLRQRQPPPTVENYHQLQQELAQCDQKYATITSKVRKIDLPFLPQSEAPNEVDFYFLVMAYRRFLAECAQKMRVLIPQNCAFGFEAHATKEVVPPKETLAKFTEQCAIAARVLVLLFGANDYGMEFQKITRETLAAEENESKTPKEKKQFPRSEKVKSYRFTLEFSSYTRALRTFLNRVLEFGLPVIWREITIHVNPTAHPEAATSADPVSVKLVFDWIFPRPYITESQDLNCTELKAVPEERGEFWSDPPQAPRGEAWTFDLFTPPTIVLKNDHYQATLPWLPQPKPETRVVFACTALERLLYPIQLLGYIIPPPDASGVSRPHFFLKNVETQESFQATLGDTVTAHSLELVDFNERGPENCQQLNLLDHELSREEILTPETKYDTQRVKVNLEYREELIEPDADALESETKTVSLTHIGENFKIGDRQYTLTSVDDAVKRVTLECDGEMIEVALES
ncbi:MAG: Amuc_1100 family pilus-like protein [Verrucomicrobiota bacterium]|nr:MAG: Amuc_1100 family pilus-like protein [Verrucomicrobiota bacterium]